MRTRTLLIALALAAAVLLGSVHARAAAHRSAIALVVAVAVAPQAADAVRDAVDDSRQAIADPVNDAQRSMAEAVVPALVAVQGTLAAALPAPLATPPSPNGQVSPAAVDMIVAFEIVSPAYYVKRLQHPVWPGGASGVTWGIGYDGGHQAATRIASDWAAHPGAERLRTTAGVIGAAAKPLAAQLRDVRTPLPLAEQVFATSTLPSYDALAARTFHTGWECVGANPRGSLTATVYNRGASMRGHSRREMRALRDDCVPRCDTACMAAQYRSMKRVWVGTSLEVGLARRYEATARLAEGVGA